MSYCDGPTRGCAAISGLLIPMIGWRYTLNVIQRHQRKIITISISITLICNLRLHVVTVS